MPLAPTTEKFDQQVRLKQRKNGKWYLCTPPPRGEVEDVRLAVTVYLGLPQTTPITQEQAREAARALAGDRARDVITPAGATRLTVGEVIAAYQDELRDSGHESADTINVALRWVLERISGWRILHLTTPALHQLRSQWLKEPAPLSRQPDGRLASSTVKFRVGWLIRALKFAEAQGRIGKHQIPSMPKFARREKRMNYLAPEEFYGPAGHEADGVLAQYDTRIFFHQAMMRHYQDATAWGYIAGWRSREIRELRWEWVHAEWIHLPAWLCKNRDGRKVPLIGSLRALIDTRRALRAYVRKAGGEALAPYVFHNGQGGRLYNKSMVSFFRKAVVAAPAVRDEAVRSTFIFHDLRRCAATNLIEAGVDVKVAMQITGHKSEKVFRDYQIMSGKGQRAAVVAVDAYLLQQRTQATGRRDNVRALPDNRPDNRPRRVAQGMET